MPVIVPAISDSEPCYTVNEVRAYFGGVSRITIYNHATKGLRGHVLVSYRVGGRIWFKESELKAFFEATSKPRQPKVKTPERETVFRPKLSPGTRERLRELGYKI